jgi:hypothetical protein
LLFIVKFDYVGVAGGYPLDAQVFVFLKACRFFCSALHSANIPFVAVLVKMTYNEIYVTTNNEWGMSGGHMEMLGSASPC